MLDIMRALRQADKPRFEGSSEYLEARTLRAISERNEEVFDSLVNEWEAFDRAKPFMNWAIYHLDAWGMDRALAKGMDFTRVHLDAYFDRLIPKAKDSVPGLAEKDDPLRAWPAIWGRLKSEPGFSHDALLKVCELWSTQNYRKNDVNWSHGRFAELLSYCPQDGVLDWFSTYASRPGRHRLSPLQLAWLGGDGHLCEALLKAGADPDQSFPASAWPNWTLRKATQDFQGLLRETMAPNAKVQDPNVKFLSDVAKTQRRDVPGLDAQLASWIRVYQLDQSLPAAAPAAFKSRF